MKNKIYFYLILSISFIIGLYSLNTMNLLDKEKIINNFFNNSISIDLENSFFKYAEGLSNYKIDDFNTYIYKNDKKKEVNTFKVEKTVEENTTNDPIIYFYNTHQKERYANGNLGVYELNPTVLSASYLIKDMLKEKKVESVVEKEDIIKIMNKRKYNYDQTYLITRELLKKTINNYPSIKYFIDLHRDSVDKKVSTITIKNKPYAKIMFVIGLKNKNSSKNLKLMEELNNLLKKKYPGISRGIYKRNYVYNQDVNPNVILIELGGQENTMEEVYNSCEALANVLIEYIGDNNG